MGENAGLGSEVWAKIGRDWADRIATAYADETTPPITPQMRDALRERLAQALTPALMARVPSGSWAQDIVNPLLDEWERELRSEVGPRLERVEEAAGTVSMGQHSEAGHPLRAFGGQ